MAAFQCSPRITHKLKHGKPHTDSVVHANKHPKEDRYAPPRIYVCVCNRSERGLQLNKMAVLQQLSHLIHIFATIKN